MSPSRSGACYGVGDVIISMVARAASCYTPTRDNSFENPKCDLSEHLQSSSTMSAPVENHKPLPVYFTGHAGVGLLFKEDENNDIVKHNLRSIGDEIRAISPPPKAILAFSGHFEAGEIHGPGVVEGQ